jgi:hypothetical protein
MDSARIRALFGSHGLALQEWNKIRTDALTIRDTSPPVSAVA